jgi:hypothetical protein
MSISDTFRLRLSPGQMRHDRVFAVGSHKHVRLDTWRRVQPNDLLFTIGGDTLSGEVSHLGYLITPQVVTGSGTIGLRDDSQPRVARPLAITFAASRMSCLIYASGQQWKDPTVALNDAFQAAEWRYVVSPMGNREADPWWEFCKELGPGENMTVDRADLPDLFFGD